RPLLVEKDDAWLNLDPSLPRWVQGGFLWSSERAGAWTLELRDAAGVLVRALSTPADGYAPAPLGGVAAADDKNVWFHGGPQPTEVHVYRAPLDGSAAAEPITHEPGVHVAAFNRAATAYVLMSSTLDNMPRVTANGNAVELPSVAESPPSMPAPTIERV